MDKQAWERDSASSTCTRCDTSFGRVLSRRHHCRYCGCLVCHSCSSQRISISGSAHGDNTPVRVCDPCFLSLTAREEKRSAQNKLTIQRSETLNARSFLSSCLVNVYFLDGSTQTLCYDESSTVADLVYEVCQLPIALFMCSQDIYDNSQYILLNRDDNVSSLMIMWQGSKPYAKIVCPSYGKTLSSSTKVDRLTSKTSDATPRKPRLREDNAFSSGQQPEQAADQDFMSEPQPQVASLAAVQLELEVAREELSSVRQQLETCKSLVWRAFEAAQEDATAGPTAGVLFELTEDEIAVFHNPALILAGVDMVVMDSFVRSFFHHIRCLDSWLQRCHGLFGELMDISVPLLTTGGDTLGGTAPDRMANLHKMFESLDRTYVFVMRSVEGFRAKVPAWSSRLLARLLTLPVQDINSLRACVGFCSDQGDAESVFLLRRSIEESVLREVAFTVDATLVVGAITGVSQFVLAAKGKGAFAAMPFAVVQRMMENIVQTYDYIVADLADLFGSAVFDIYFEITRLLCDEVVQVYARAQSKAFALHEHIVHYQFLEKLSRILAAHGDIVADVWLPSVRHGKVECAQQTCQKLVAQVKGSLRFFQVPAGSHAFHNMTCTASTSTSSSLGGECTEQEAAAAFLKLLTDIEDKSGSLIEPIGTNCIGFSGGDDCPILAVRWPLQLFDCLASLLHDVIKVRSAPLEVHSAFEASSELTLEQRAAMDSVVRKGDIRGTLVVLLFDTFITELSVAFGDVASQLPAGSPQLVIALVCAMNNHLLFAHYLQKLQAYYWRSLENLLHDKLDIVAEKYQRLVVMQFEYVGRFVDAYAAALHSDLKRLVEQKFFNSPWESDVVGVIAVKRLIKSRVVFLRRTLVSLEDTTQAQDQELSAASAVSTLLPLLTGELRGGVASTTKVSEALALNMALRAFESLVRVYIEQLLLSFGNGMCQSSTVDAKPDGEDPRRRPSRSSFSMTPTRASFSLGRSSIDGSASSRQSYSYFQSITASTKGFRVLNITIINRLNEDLQLFLALSEDMRALFNPDPAWAVRCIATTAKLRSPFKAVVDKYFKAQPTSASIVATPSSTDDQDHSATSDDGGSGGSAERQQFKQLFDGAWQVLQHVVYAAQMDKQYLPAFVKDCLYPDLGYEGALKIYSFLLFWRGESTETIGRDFAQFFSAWRPRRASLPAGGAAVFSIPLLHNIKAANLVPVDPQMEA